MYTYTLEVQSPFFSPVGFRSTIFLVEVYHLPKGTTIFLMVVDLRGVYIYIHRFNCIEKSGFFQYQKNMYRRLHWNSDRAKQFRSQWWMLHVKTAYTVYIRWCEYLYIHICIGFTWVSCWCSPGGCTNFDDLGRPGFQHSKTTSPNHLSSSFSQLPA